MTDHPDNLHDFVSLRLDDEATTAVMAHLADCEHCLAEVDALWERMPEARDYRPPLELDPVEASRLEDQLVRRIRRSDLGGRIIWLSTNGFASVFLALLRPILAQGAGSGRSAPAPGQPTSANGVDK